MEHVNKQTLLGIACASCGRVTDEPKVLRRAIFRSWTCPSCGALNKSLNDAAEASHVIEVRAEPEPAAEAAGEEPESVLVVQSTPEELERMKREFLARTSL